MPFLATMFCVESEFQVQHVQFLHLDCCKFGKTILHKNQGKILIDPHKSFINPIILQKVLYFSYGIMHSRLAIAKQLFAGLYAENTFPPLHRAHKWDEYGGGIR